MDCQIHQYPAISEGKVPLGPLPLRSRIKLMLKRLLPASAKRTLKKRLAGPAQPALNVEQAQTGASSAVVFAPGDRVRIRSREEIEATLDRWDELKGCQVMASMWQYCGTVQRVLKPVERFVDERDYRVKKARGLVLLEGLMCEGTPEYGRCDRACFYFWRAEWLEKLDHADAAHEE
jgi:hypothetical protein